MRVLGIETSCDETGIAIYDTEKGLLAESLYSQVKMHAEFGGVVPELASRDHIRKCLPLLDKTLQTAGLKKSQLDGIAYTAGPGLMGALMVGVCMGQTIARTLGIPSLGVHHMEGHLLAPMLEDKKPKFPFLALLVSGGHTMLVLVKALGEYQILGESLDDAVGEAFDKTAKILGLGYPGGAALEKAAKESTNSPFQFPRPMTDRPGLDFSFSGLKTFALNTVTKEGIEGSNVRDIAKAFQDAVIDTLLIKCKRALKETHASSLVIAGGVSANTALREGFQSLGESLSVDMFFPRPAFCTDNGAMIAYAGALRLARGEKDTGIVKARPRWSLEEL